MTDLPAPLVAPNVDLGKLDGFMLDTVRLLGSELVALSTGDEFKAAVLLWCRSWKQTPACSLPDDDRILASFAQVTASKWKKIRPMALRGFVKCSDGRLYHKVLALDAARAHKAAEQRREAIRKRWEKANGAGGGTDTGKPTEQIRPYYETPTEPIPKTGRDGTVSKKEEGSEPNGSGDPASDALKALFDFGVSILTAASVKERDARSLVGKWRSKLKDDAKLMEILMTANKQAAVDPVAYIERAIAGPPRALSMAEKIEIAERRKRAAS